MKPYETVAVGFAKALVDGDYDAARELLVPPLREGFTADKLKYALYRMFSGYAPDDKPTDIWYDPQFALERWPAARPGDLASVYVGISGDAFNEAVTVIVTNHGGTPLIRHIQWGRP